MWPINPSTHHLLCRNSNCSLGPAPDTCWNEGNIRTYGKIKLNCGFALSLRVKSQERQSHSYFSLIHFPGCSAHTTQYTGVKHPYSLTQLWLLLGLSNCPQSKVNNSCSSFVNIHFAKRLKSIITCFLVKNAQPCKLPHLPCAHTWRDRKKMSRKCFYFKGLMMRHFPANSIWTSRQRSKKSPSFNSISISELW